MGSLSASSDESRKKVRQATNSSSVSTHTHTQSNGDVPFKLKDRKAAQEQQRRKQTVVKRDMNLLTEEFTPDSSPQLSARVGMALGSRRFVHATPFLQALAHRVQVTVCDHDLRHPDLNATQYAAKTEGLLAPL